jgi:hypothetical protein
MGKKLSEQETAFWIGMGYNPLKEEEDRKLWFELYFVLANHSGRMRVLGSHIREAEGIAEDVCINCLEPFEKPEENKENSVCGSFCTRRTEKGEYLFYCWFVYLKAHPELAVELITDGKAWD